MISACGTVRQRPHPAGAAARRAERPIRATSHHQALHAQGNRLVGILHGCLARRVTYQEQVA
jgi:hypothetical protein